MVRYRLLDEKQEITRPVERIIIQQALLVRPTRSQPLVVLSQRIQSIIQQEASRHILKLGVVALGLLR